MAKAPGKSEDDTLIEKIAEGTAPDSIHTDARYAAYANRVRTILKSAHRYVAYTSDIGESFRPVAHPYLVKGAYAVSWLYLLGDVANEGYKAYTRQHPPHQKVPPSVSPLEDYRVVMAKRAVFQGVASMGLPAFTIHSVVKYSGKALKDAKNKTIRTWAPIGLGLAIVPFLPYIFDEPVEHAVDWGFEKGFEALGKKPAEKVKEKEL
ncbi:mitochondrial 18 KDa protein-domain-containing protein [Sphaerosporella brunnea]|uniref:Mitochondrial fission process protein 1 n=1 Tax=Sphaerosporella brunnea TaxID=1250544 RepID=A0A5J5FAR7_9PEZI|nr:mitochondrial 18 KDa protein-domain-containing protein [Sphaerosporella brunnea]